MRYNVADLLKAETGWTRRIEVDEPFHSDDLDVELVGPIQGDLTFTRDHAGVLVQGELGVTVRLPCVRCLEPVEAEVSFELSEQFLPTVYIPGGPDLTDKAEREAETEIDEHHVLDLTEVVRQNLDVAMPIHTVCREECRGLCPQCGTNWNEAECDCEPPTDPRWDALKELMDDVET